MLYPLHIYREGEKEIHVGAVYISGNYVNRCGSIRYGVSPLLFSARTKSSRIFPYNIYA